ncbi:MAG: hypothetical protein GWN00_25635 [Aliifodinibius sp.]|nr:hypothetical protein [Fodinibius sp.]NIW98959.1 hypothetical protein [Phycisphaerae bacterium]NIY28057.1 hypothetical protein [Fodinibius sp.]
MNEQEIQNELKQLRTDGVPEERIRHIKKIYELPSKCSKPSEPLLKKGDWIRVHGFVMLQGLDNGKEYEVNDIFTHRGKPAYRLRPKYVRKYTSMVGHTVRDIDRWIDNNSTINYIEILNK